MPYYVLSTSYVGVNAQQHLDDDYYAISTEPGRTNSSHEERTEGWLGTTNDWSRCAHGVYQTIEEARAEIERLTPEGRRRVDPDEYSETEIVCYRVGALEPMSREASADFVYDDARSRVTAETTDGEIAEWVADAADEMATEGYALDQDAATETYTAERDRQISEDFHHDPTD